MFRRTLTKTHHTRLFTIQKLTDAGWELRIEQDSRTVRTVRYSDWHRVERAMGSIERQVGQWWPSARLGRSLDITNDFREPFDSGSTLGALFSVDDYDYVDRHVALAGLTRFLTRGRDVRLRAERHWSARHDNPDAGRARRLDVLGRQR